MRVHGKHHIRRREETPCLSDYSDARDAISEDFHHICGYCGKAEFLARQSFHIDHFIPSSLYPEGKTDYGNLVWSCPKCNRIKSNKWPTQDPLKAHDEKVGFVDPATEEYDVHLQRSEKGFIVGCTELGRGICGLMHFDVRPTDLYWRAGRLQEILRLMEELHEANLLSDDAYRFYVSANIFWKHCLMEAFYKGE